MLEYPAAQSKQPATHERLLSEVQSTQDRAQKNRGVHENFLKTILEFNKKHNTPIQEQPQLDGKFISLYTLYGYVLKAGGSEAVEEHAHWGHIATALGFTGQGHSIADIHKRCLREYEKEWLAKRRASQPRMTLENSDKTIVNSNDMVNSVAPTKELKQSQKESPTAEHIHDHAPHAKMAPKHLYKPVKRTLDTFAGTELHTMSMIGKDAARLRPYPTFQELGRLDIQGAARSIESGLPAEVGNALDILTVIAGDRRWGLPLIHCGDLLEVLVECMSDSLACLSCQRASSIMPYSELVYDALHISHRRSSAWTFTDDVGCTNEFALQRVMSVMTILRNLAFTEINQEPIARAPQLLSTLAVGINTFCSTDRSSIIPETLALDFAKDCITLLSLLGAFVVIEDQEQFSTLFLFLLSFAPIDTPVATKDISLLLSLNPYLAPAIDATAKVFSRDEPNRRLCETFLSTSAAPQAWSQSTKLMILATAILPSDLTEESTVTISKRLPLLQHSLIVAEFATDMTPMSGETPTRWTNESVTCCLRLMALWKIMSKMVPVAGMTEIELVTMTRRVMLLIGLLHNKIGSNLPVNARGSRKVWSELKILIQTAEADFAPI